MSRCSKHGTNWDPFCDECESEAPESARGSLPASNGSALLTWAVERWNAEVKNRPLVNIYRRILDDTWRQVIRFAGGNDRELVGPTHDELAASNDGGQR